MTPTAAGVRRASGDFCSWRWQTGCAGWIPVARCPWTGEDAGRKGDCGDDGKDGQYEECQGLKSSYMKYIIYDNNITTYQNYLSGISSELSFGGFLFVAIPWNAQVKIEVHVEEWR